MNMVGQRKRYCRYKLPFVPGEKTLLCLVPKGYDTVSLEKKMDSIREFYEIDGYQLLYLPDLIDGIDTSLQDFFFPGNRGRLPDAESLQAGFLKALHLGLNAPVCIRFKRFHYFISKLWIPADPEPVQPQEISIAKQAEDVPDVNEALTEKKTDDCGPTIRFRMTEQKDDVPDMPWLNLDLNEYKSREKTGMPEPVKPVEEEDTYVTINLSELRRLGIDEKILEQILGARKKLSRLHITRNGNVILEDYDMEIKMDVLEKCLFFLFLRHPEGIRLKEISDYKKELLDYYMSLSGRDDKSAMEETIARLVEFGNNSVNVLLSRIKTHFSSAIKDSIAENYYVRGKKGDTKSITLDRSLVIWDAVRQ